LSTGHSEADRVQLLHSIQKEKFDWRRVRVTVYHFSVTVTL
jgi:hypothetical protein